MHGFIEKTLCMCIINANTVGIIALMFFVSCGNKNEKSVKAPPSTKEEKVVNKVDQSVLSEYFRTNQINIDTFKHSIEVSVSNAKLLAVKKEKMGARWESPEPWVSVSATYQAKSLSEDVDSLFYNVTMNEQQYRYAYSVKQLQKANSYISTCEQFASFLNAKDFNAVKALLSVDITKAFNDDGLRNFLKYTFSEEVIDRTELIGTKIVGTKYSFYINFWDAHNQGRTYAFSFMEGSNKIAGIQIAK